MLPGGTVIKRVGEVLETTYPVSNDDEVTGDIRTSVEVDGIVVSESAYIPINPGQTVEVSLDWTVDVPLGEHTAELRVTARAPGRAEGIVTELDWPILLEVIPGLGAETDFKVPRVTYHDDSTVTAFVRFYEGDVTTEDEDGVPVTRYRRTAVVIRPKRDIDTQLARIGRAVQVGNGWEITFKNGVDVGDSLRRILAEDALRLKVNTADNDRPFVRPSERAR